MIRLRARLGTPEGVLTPRHISAHKHGVEVIMPVQ
jgi:hypothetical protein